MEGIERPPARSRWRYCALPLLPFVAAWDCLCGVARAWAEFGVRMLDRLDPFFARVGAAWFRMAERLRPIFEGVMAPFRWIAERAAPAVERASAAITALLAPVRRLASAVGNALTPAMAAVRSACVWLTTPLRWAGRQVAKGWRVLRVALAEVWAAVRRFTAEALGRTA